MDLCLIPLRSISFQSMKKGSKQQHVIQYYSVICYLSFKTLTPCLREIHCCGLLGKTKATTDKRIREITVSVFSKFLINKYCYGNLFPLRLYIIFIYVLLVLISLSSIYNCLVEITTNVSKDSKTRHSVLQIV